MINLNEWANKLCIKFTLSITIFSNGRRDVTLCCTEKILGMPEAGNLLNS